MKPTMSWLEYQQLELIIPESSKYRLKPVYKKLLNDIGKFLVRHLFVSPDVQIWCTYDDQRNIWWNAYDPVSRRSIYRLSEEQMLVWVEQRYYTGK